MLWHFQSPILQIDGKGQSRVNKWVLFGRVQINLQASGVQQNVHTLNTAGDRPCPIIRHWLSLPQLLHFIFVSQCTQLDILLYSSKQLDALRAHHPKNPYSPLLVRWQGDDRKSPSNHKSSQGLFLAMLWPRLGLTNNRVMLSVTIDRRRQEFYCCYAMDTSDLSTLNYRRHQKEVYKYHFVKREV